LIAMPEACLPASTVPICPGGDEATASRGHAKCLIDVDFFYKQTGDAQAKAADSRPILQTLLTK
jgi:hypothetical protein